MLSFDPPDTPLPWGVKHQNHVTPHDRFPFNLTPWRQLQRKPIVIITNDMRGVMTPPRIGTVRRHIQLDKD